MPVLRLDVELWTDKGKRLGLLARLRDVLPGRYALGLTGRGPAGTPLEPGAYRFRLRARGASRLLIDGIEVAKTEKQKPNTCARATLI